MMHFLVRAWAGLSAFGDLWGPDSHSSQNQYAYSNDSPHLTAIAGIRRIKEILRFRAQKRKFNHTPPLTRQRSL